MDDASTRAIYEVERPDDAIADYKARIAELEGDLSVARLALKRIDEELVGSYGEIATMRAEEVRRILGNIAYIIKPVI